MKKLTNKKGFTLIEMLVVIAIIAILVAIIIPVVSSSTAKAAAATNAANLRSIKAEATTEVLSGVANTDGYVSVNKAENGTITVSVNEATAPKSKAVGNQYNGNEVATISYDANTKEVTVKYGSYTIKNFADAAESGTLAAASTTPSNNPGGNQQGGGN